MKAIALSVALALTVSVVAFGRSTQGTVYEPGNGITLPQVVKEVNPVYPPEAKESRVQGTVWMKCTVATDGKPVDIEVIRSLEPRLDEAAVAALRQWEFKPGTKNGEAVAVRVTVEMTFTWK